MKYLLRDLLWLIAVVSVAAGWYASSRKAVQTIEAQAKTIDQQQAEIASRDADLDRAARQERQLRTQLRLRGAPVELFPSP